jgi:hypothetical protein
MWRWRGRDLQADALPPASASTPSTDPLLYRTNSFVLERPGRHELRDLRDSNATTVIRHLSQIVQGGDDLV